MESRTRGVLDTRLRGYDGGGWSIVIDVVGVDWNKMRSDTYSLE
jgi:hypothetical protein